MIKQPIVVVMFWNCDNLHQWWFATRHDVVTIIYLVYLWNSETNFLNSWKLFFLVGEADWTERFHIWFSRRHMGIGGTSFSKLPIRTLRIKYLWNTPLKVFRGPKKENLKKKSNSNWWMDGWHWWQQLGEEVLAERISHEAAVKALLQ